MSQSGIVASQSVIDDFKSFETDHALSALILSIEKEAIKVLNKIDNEGSFEEIWSKVQQYLTETSPRYIFIKKNLGSDSKALIFISYVPDQSPVREKMIYASTKSNFLKQLPNYELIEKKYLINDLDDISYDNYLELQKSDNAAAPLTAREINLKKIHSLEDEAAEFQQQQTGRRLVTMHNLNNMKQTLVEEDVFENLNNITEKFMVSLKIDLNDETVKYNGYKDNIALENLIEVIQEDLAGPEYIVYKKENNDNVFIYTCPSGSKIKERMLYASTKQGLLKKLKENKIEIKKVIEVGDPVEIEITEIKNINDSPTGTGNNLIDETPITAVSHRLNKPRAPRRR